MWLLVLMPACVHLCPWVCMLIWPGRRSFLLSCVVCARVGQHTDVLTQVSHQFMVYTHTHVCVSLGLSRCWSHIPHLLVQYCCICAKFVGEDCLHRHKHTHHPHPTQLFIFYLYISISIHIYIYACTEAHSVQRTCARKWFAEFLSRAGFGTGTRGS